MKDRNEADERKDTKFSYLIDISITREQFCESLHVKCEMIRRFRKDVI